MKIGSHELTAQDPYIIAEIGSNWTSFEDAKQAIQLVKVAGAHAVKFQLFDHLSLYGLPGKMSHELPPEWIPLLAEKAKSAGIDFLCSPFSEAFVDLIEPHVPAFKVASAELPHAPMLLQIRRKGKPVILSTGGATDGDITMALRFLRDPRVDPSDPVEVCLLYTVAAYPARYVNMLAMEDLAKKFSVPIGYSDHTLSISHIAKDAKRAGAVLIEKHVTTISVQTPDSAHSVSLEEFKTLVDELKGLVPPQLRNGREEKEFIEKHKRRLVVTKPINQGETLTYGLNYGVFRSLTRETKGLSGLSQQAVEGKRAARAFQPGETIGPGEFRT